MAGGWGGLGLIIISNLNRVRLSCCWVGVGLGCDNMLFILVGINHEAFFKLKGFKKKLNKSPHPSRANFMRNPALPNGCTCSLTGPNWCNPQHSGWVGAHSTDQTCVFIELCKSDVCAFVVVDCCDFDEMN